MNMTDKQIIKQEWYSQLVDECKAIITEAVFTSRWALVEGYWNLGKTFRENKNFDTNLLQDLAVKIGISERTGWYAIQTFDKYPDISKLPEGKNITWNKLITKYLPEAPKEETPQLPEGQFSVIYSDPPWQYDNSGISGAAQNHYPTMKTEDICNLKVPSSENSVLFLWVTNPFLKEGIQVCESWGFEYKTNIVWIKERAGQGFYVKGQHELLFIAVKGNMRPDNSLYIRSIVSEPKGEHSEKPIKFYEIIETLYPNQKYLEMFARSKRNGRKL